MAPCLEIKAAGILLYRNSLEGQTEYLLVQNKREEWTPPKGKLNKRETWFQGAVREVWEETGLKNNHDFRLSNSKDTYYETTYLDESKRKTIQKTSRYFLGKVVNKKARIRLETQELKTFQWFSAEEAKKMMRYPEMCELISYFEQ